MFPTRWSDSIRSGLDWQDSLCGVGLPVADIPLDDPRMKAGSDRMKIPRPAAGGFSRNSWGGRPGRSMDLRPMKSAGVTGGRSSARRLSSL
jgi:hypothetical protein